MSLAITRAELTAADLRRQAARTRDAKAARRMLAIALVLEGHSRTEAATSCGMDRQTLRDWVHRYNAEGLAGLSDRPGRPGPKPRLSPAQEAELERWVETGPDLARHGVVRCRRVDLRDLIEQRFGVRLHERTVGKLLRRLDFRHLSVRPQHPDSSPAGQEAYKKTSSAWSAPPCRSGPAAGRSRSGSRTRPGWGSRARSPGSGPGEARAPERRAIAATPRPGCSAPSARPGAWAPAWCCRRSMPRR